MDDDKIILGLVLRINDSEKINLIISKIMENGGEVIYRATARPPTRLFINRYKPLRGKENENRKS